MLKAMGETALGFDELVRKVADRLDTDPSLVRERVRSAPDASAARGRRGESGRSRPSRSRSSLTPRETRERALLAMCIAEPKAGRGFIERLTEEHLSSAGRPALGWLREHLDDPTAGLPRDDEELTSLITELVMRAESEPASEGAMQLNFDLLEQQRLEDGIAAAQKAGDYEVSTRLSGERAELHGPHRARGRRGLARLRNSAHSARSIARFPCISRSFRPRIRPRRGGKCLQMTKEELEGYLAEGLSLEQIGKRVGRQPVDGQLPPEEARPLRPLDHGRFAPPTRRSIRTAGRLSRQKGRRQRMPPPRSQRQLFDVRYWLEKYGLGLDRQRRCEAAPSSRRARLAGDAGGRVGVSPSRNAVQFVERPDGALPMRAGVGLRPCANRRRRRQTRRSWSEAGGSLRDLRLRPILPCALQFHHLDPARESVSD